MRVAACHPGKHGDALYALPTIRALALKHGCKVDFYTSSYCEPLRSLFEAQECINRFIVSPTYVLERMDMGAQPYCVPVEGEYEAVYQLGFQGIPDRAIPDYIASEVGIEHAGVHYDLTGAVDYVKEIHSGEYYVLAPRGETSFTPIFREFIQASPISVIIIGSGDDAKPFQDIAATATTLSYLDTAKLIEGSSGFVGIMSSQLVLANGFDIPKVVVHDGKSWDMRHVVRGKFNRYPVNPEVSDILELLSKEHYVSAYCKTIDPKDYETSDLFTHVDNMVGIMDGLYTTWGTEFRKWEYGTALKALRENGARTVLDVGGGSSMFAAAATWAGFDVTVVDPDDYVEMFKRQSDRIGKDLPYVRQDYFDYDAADQFDAVVCLSVIEHVQNDVPFFEKLLKYVTPGGILVLTTDFDPNQKAHVYPSHLRTYDAKTLLGMIEVAKARGFEVFGAKPNYKKFEPLIYNLYSFASLVLKRVS